MFYFTSEQDEHGEYFAIRTSLNARVIAYAEHRSDAELIVKGLNLATALTLLDAPQVA